VTHARLILVNLSPGLDHQIGHDRPELRFRDLATLEFADEPLRLTYSRPTRQATSS
jgi:hypothetical protein